MKSFKKSALAVGLIGSLVASAGIAASHSAKSSNAAVAARHAQMQIVGYSIGILGAVAKGEMEYDAAMVESAAMNLNKMATLDRATLWIEGTEQGAVDGSRAKAEIWSDPDGFGAIFDKLAEASLAVASAGDAAAVGAGLGAVGGTCKECHETYRGPKN